MDVHGTTAPIDAPADGARPMIGCADANAADPVLILDDRRSTLGPPRVRARHVRASRSKLSELWVAPSRASRTYRMVTLGDSSPRRSGLLQRGFLLMAPLQSTDLDCGRQPSGRRLDH